MQPRGNVRILGNDSVGVKAGDVTGNVILRTGSIEGQGGNSVGVSLTSKLTNFSFSDGLQRIETSVAGRFFFI